MESPYSRRRLLGAVGAALAPAGCLDSAGRTATETDRDCGERWNLSFGEELGYGSNAGFSLSVSPERVAFGEAVTFELRNESEETKTTGVEELYTVQRRKDGVWTNLFAEPGGFDGAAIQHDPGEGFDWTLTFTRSSIEGAWQTTCGPLVGGTYRFVYFGLPAPESGGSDRAVAVEFAVEMG